MILDIVSSDGARRSRPCTAAKRARPRAKSQSHCADADLPVRLRQYRGLCRARQSHGACRVLGDARAAGNARIHVQRPRHGRAAAVEEHRIRHRGHHRSTCSSRRQRRDQGVPARAGDGSIQALVRRGLLGPGQVLRLPRPQSEDAGRSEGQAYCAWAAHAKRFRVLRSFDPGIRLRRDAEECRHPPRHA